MAGLLMLVFVLMFTSTTTQAASQKTKAMKAYASFLSKNRYLKWTDQPNMRTGRAKNCYFAVAYIDNNDVPELVLYTPDSYHMAGYGVMYTYRNGRVVRVFELGLDLRSTLGYYKVSAKYSCGFSNTLISSIIVGERYLDYFTTITEDRLWQLLAKPVFRWRNRSGLSMNAAKAV